MGDSLRRQRVHLLDQIGPNVHHVMRAGMPRARVIRSRPDRRDYRRARSAGELYGADSNNTGAALYKHDPSFDWTRNVHTAMRGNGGNTEAGTLLERDTRGKRDGLRRRNGRVFRGRAERTV